GGCARLAGGHRSRDRRSGDGRGPRPGPGRLTVLVRDRRRVRRHLLRRVGGEVAVFTVESRLFLGTSVVGVVLAVAYLVGTHDRMGSALLFGLAVAGLLATVRSLD